MVNNEEAAAGTLFTIHHLPFTGNGISRTPEMKRRGTDEAARSFVRPSPVSG
jgi:hypothetical protein